MDKRENKLKKRKLKIFASNFVHGLVMAGIFAVLVVPITLHTPITNAASGAVSTAEIESIPTDKAAAERKGDDIDDVNRENLAKRLQSAAAIAWRNSLSYFLNTLAYDTATWLASGGEGQQPLFYTEGWGEYLTGLADGAAGSFLETIGEEGFGGINICDPGSLDLKINLGISIADIQRPRKPRCTASEIVNNFQDIANDPDFLNKISPIFDTRQNDVGIALTFFGKYYEKVANEEIAGENERKEGEGIKGVTELISKKILTPGRFVGDAFRKILDDGTKGETTFTGEIVADAIDTFTQTLAGRLFQRLFKEGLAALSGSGRSGGGSFNRPNLFNPDGGNSTSNANAAQERFLTFFDAGVITGGPYKILQTLVTCANPDNPGPEECVIDQRLRLAIEQELTVREAIDIGYLDGNAPFGYVEKDVQPHYREGYPYRSLLIMRAHRIVPVGWEIAAKAANDFRSDSLPYTLNELILEFDKCEGQVASPFCGLIDPSWVLKAPEHLCKAEGPGPIAISEQIVNGKQVVSRADYCADYQSCIDEDENGNCRFYGYCVEEKSSWNLQAKNCEPLYNTCTTYQSGDGDLVNYLANTIDYNGCSADNAGCQWYCTQYNNVSDEWTCQADGEEVLQTCPNDAGCRVAVDCLLVIGETTCTSPNSTSIAPIHPQPPDLPYIVSMTLSQACSEGSQTWDDTAAGGTGACVFPLSPPVDQTCIIPDGGVACEITGCELLPGLLANGSFETGSSVPGALAENWSTNTLTYFERVSGATEKIHQGSSSLRFFSFGGSVNAGPPGSNVVSSDSFDLPADSYTFSGWVYNRLNLGEIEIEVNGVIANSTIKNGWQKLTRNFTGGLGTQIIIRVIDQSNQVNGIAWFDDFQITQQCIAGSRRLILASAIDVPQSKIHFDRDVESCDPDSEGCSAFIRTIPNSGTNLVRNSSFENWPNPLGDPQGWELQAGNIEIATSSPFDSKSLLIGPGVNILNESPIEGMKANTSYNVSAYIKANIPTTQSLDSLRFDLDTGSGPIVLEVNGEDNLAIGTEWQRVIFDTTQTENSPVVRLSILNPTQTLPADERDFYIDGVQIEEVATDDPFTTNYKYYGSANIVHLQKPPAGLLCTGDFLTDPDECNNYALYCQANEVGCESYNPIQGGIPIPGVVSPGDYCPAECVGYDTFKQSTTFFESVESLEFFIPDTARQCNISQVGCDEFTNLDEVALGGEGREYFTYLRQCELPDDSSCKAFFTWQGSEDTGFQLRAHNLSSDIAGVPIEAIPYTGPGTNWPEQWCDDLSAGANGNPACCDESLDSFTNPFCKEYIDTDGAFHYRIELNTIQCSSNCHPFRKTALGEDPLTAENNCKDSNGFWDDTACIYQAIPDQGLSCSAAAAGCREYRGNTGGNIFIAFSDNFEDGELSGWRFGAISNEALSVTGHSIVSESVGTDERIVTMVGSLQPIGTICSNALPVCDNTTFVDCYDASVDRCVAVDAATPNNETCFVANGETDCGVIDELLNADREYIISFWAKSNNNPINDMIVELASIGLPSVNIANTNFVTDWNYYTFGPFSDSNMVGSSRLQLRTPTAGLGPFFVDNIEIKEIQNYAYVVKGSWNTPVSCDTNPFIETPIPGAQPQFMLGCKQYEDSGNRVHNLKQFTNLCREEVVGCEALIDTYNSNSPFVESFNVNDPIANVEVAADKLVYLVNQLQYRCSENFEGCSVFGFPIIELDENDEDVVTGNHSVYLINDPDDYNTILCNSEEVGCEEYKTNDGLAYFKNPGPRLCELRFVPSTGINEWFKIGSNSSTGDCDVIVPPIGEIHPTDGYVGLCPANQNSCNLFIDPSSNVAKNLLFNPDLEQDLDFDDIPDGWTNIPFWALQQNVNLKANTQYTVSLVLDLDFVIPEVTDFLIYVGQCTGGSSIISSYDRSMVEHTAGVYKIPETAYLQDNRTNSGLSNIRQYSGRFMVDGETSCTLNLSQILGGVASIRELVKEVQVKETILNYALSNTVDKFSCNGQVDQNQGCVLFNDRSAINYKLGEDDNTYLLFDSDVSGPGINSGAPVPNCNGVCDTNAVLKVRPDRECAQWLSCSTIATEVQPNGSQIDRCLNLVACDELNEDGTCASTANFEQQADRTYLTPGGVDQLRYMSGFATAGIQGLGGLEVVGYYPYHLMEQSGESAVVANGNFETTIAGTTEPIAWTSILDGVYLKWEEYRANIGSDPTLFKEGTGYLNLNSIYRLESDYIDVFGGNTYTISGWINTLDLFPTPESEASIMIREFFPNGKLVPFNMTNCNSLTGECQVSNPNGQTTLQKWDALVIKAGLPWTFVSQTFKTAPQTGRLKVRLMNLEGTATFAEISGRSRFDDISIKPVLQVADNNLFVNRTCRLYPSSDAPSCSFINDQNQVFKGWQGFCITVDPNNPDSCLQWWPVDQLRGEEINEIVEFDGPVPLYMCGEGKPGERIYEYRRAYYSHKDCDTGNNRCPDGYSSARVHWNDCSGWSEGRRFRYYCYPTINPEITGWRYDEPVQLDGIIPMPVDLSDTTALRASFLFNKTNNAAIRSPGDGWYVYDGQDRTKGSFFYDGAWAANNPGVDGQFEKYKSVLDCSTLVNVVSDTGQNKAWTARVSEGSAYKVPDLGFSYQTQNSPFGSIFPPDPVTDPLSWERLTATNDTTLANAGTPYSCSGTAADPNGCHPDALVWDYNDLNAPFPDAGLNENFVWARDRMKFIFAQNNNIFEWDTLDNVGTCNFITKKCTGGASNRSCSSDIECLASSGYAEFNDSETDLGWSVPRVLCEDNQRVSTNVTGNTVGTIIETHNILAFGDFESWYAPSPSLPDLVPSGWDTGSPGSFLPIITQGLGEPVGGGSFSLQFENRTGSGEFDLLSQDMYVPSNATALNVTFSAKANQSILPAENRFYVELVDLNGGTVGRTYLNLTTSWNTNFDIPLSFTLGTSYQLVIGSLAGSDNRILTIDNIEVLVTTETATIITVTGDDNYCAVAPVINNIKLNGARTGPINILGKGNVNLIFNVDIDENQLPLKAYRVDWGDNTGTSYSGVNLRGRPNPEHNFSLNHYYDYWQVRSQFNEPLKNNISFPIVCSDVTVDEYFCSGSSNVCNPSDPPVEPPTNLLEGGNNDFENWPTPSVPILADYPPQWSKGNNTEKPIITRSNDVPPGGGDFSLAFHNTGVTGAPDLTTDTAFFLENNEKVTINFDAKATSVISANQQPPEFFISLVLTGIIDSIPDTDRLHLDLTESWRNYTYVLTNNGASDLYRFTLNNTHPLSVFTMNIDNVSVTREVIGCVIGETCQQKEYCDVHIAIQARDNWGWCNGNLDEEGIPPANRWGYFSGNNSYTFNGNFYEGYSPAETTLCSINDPYNLFCDDYAAYQSSTVFACIGTVDLCNPGNPILPPSCGGNSLNCVPLREPRFDCDDLDARTQFNPSFIGDGAIRVFDR